MAVISLADDRDHASLPPQPPAWDELAGEVTGLRSPSCGSAGAGSPVDPEITAAVASAAAALERAGAHVEPAGTAAHLAVRRPPSPDPARRRVSALRAIVVRDG